MNWTASRCASSTRSNPRACKSSVRDASMKSRYVPWYTTPPASVWWEYTRTGHDSVRPSQRGAPAAPCVKRSGAGTGLLIAEELAARGPARRREPEVPIGRHGGHAPARGALQEPTLDEERLQHVLDRVALLADRVREVVDSNRSAAELLHHRAEELAIHDVQADRVDVEHRERRVGHVAGDHALRLHLRVVAHAPQQAVRDARGAAGAGGNLERALGGDLDREELGRAVHDPPDLLGGVELEPGDDAEAVAQRIGEHPGARRRADERERREVELHRARRRALADHDVDLVVLERRVQDLLDDRREPVDLVDEEDIVRLEVGQDRGEVARALEHRTRRLPEVHSHLARDDVRERRLAEARRAEEQHVVERLAPRACRLDEDRELPADLLLPDVLGKLARAEAPLEGLLVRRSLRGRDQAIGFDHRLATQCRKPSIIFRGCGLAIAIDRPDRPASRMPSIGA